MKQNALFSIPTSVRIAVLLAVANGNAFASGFQLQEQSASGLGLAYSGMAAATQDATTAWCS